MQTYVEDQTTILVSDIQNLVSSIRGDADVRQITSEMDAIDVIVGKVITETQASGHGELVVRLAECREQFLEANDRGQDMGNIGIDPASREWHLWTQTIPPIAFEIARETKDLVQRVEQLTMSNGGDDFS